MSENKFKVPFNNILSDARNKQFVVFDKNLIKKSTIKDQKQEIYKLYVELKKKISHFDPIVSFFHGELVSLPDLLTIYDYFSKWSGNYFLLETKHGFIQWFFPTTEKSRYNEYSFPASLETFEHMRRCEKCTKHFIHFYCIMLDFYGFKIKNPKTGNLILPSTTDEKSRFYNMFINQHNLLRITRILSSLCLIGLRIFSKSLLDALEEMTNPLSKNTRTSELPLLLSNKQNFDVEKSKSMTIWKNLVSREIKNENYIDNIYSVNNNQEIAQYLAEIYPPKKPENSQQPKLLVPTEESQIKINKTARYIPTEYVKPIVLENDSKKQNDLGEKQKNKSLEETIENTLKQLKKI